MQYVRAGTGNAHAIPSLHNAGSAVPSTLRSTCTDSDGSSQYASNISLTLPSDR